MKRLPLILFLTGSALVPHAFAVQLNSLFSDHMVLQRDLPLFVWGTGKDGENVSVQISDQTVSATVVDGKWSVRLQPLSAGGPFTLTVKGDNIVTVQDVLVGEVWVCSGQSNMERQLGPRPQQPLIDNWQQTAATADFPNIREYYVPEKGAPNPVDDAHGAWTVCSPQTALQFTAVGFFFARELYQKLNIPIGIVFTAVGGTPAEAWTSREALLGKPETAGLVENLDKAVQEYQSKLDQWNQDSASIMEKYNQDVAAAQQAGKPLPHKPGPPRTPLGEIHQPAQLYNAMIAPLKPYAMRGVIWYQGEANCKRGRQYQTLFPLMIDDWRKAWGEGDFPFLFVQIAPFTTNTPDVREAQLLTLKNTPDTAMVVTTDIGDANNIHPSHKEPVGVRLALAARALAYGEKIEFSGPIFDSVDFQGNKAVAKFTHVGGGLAARGDTLRGFEVAGADRKFVPAQATISGDTVVASSDQVPNPTALRYGWANAPDVNLLNQDGLPASPFRTDDY